MWLPFPISDDIIIQLFLFFTNSFRNPSSIMYIDRGIVSTTLLKVVCKLRMCNNPIRCHYDPREFAVCCLNLFRIEGRCPILFDNQSTTTTVFVLHSISLQCMYIYISIMWPKLALSPMTIDIKDRYLFLPTCYCIKTTEDRAKPSHSLCAQPHHHDDDRWGRS